jgi:uncharacterized coiled-coil protein SlyX
VTTDQVIYAAIGLITSAGGGLTALVLKLWAWVAKRIDDCEADRSVLHGKIEGLNDEILTISTTVARMEGHMQHIDKRQDKNEQANQ